MSPPLAAWAALAAILLVASPAGAQSRGTTSLRLDALDATRSPQGEFIFYASFLDEYFKPITVTDPTQWSITFNGEAPRGEISVKTITETERGVSLVVVTAADELFNTEGLYEHARRGISRLLNALRAADQSALVVFSESVEATNSLSPSHNDAIAWLRERKPGGQTPLLFEAIDKALEMFPADTGSVGPNRAMVVLSDGGDKDEFDNAKTVDHVQKTERLAKQRNVRIHVIGVAVLGDDKLKRLVGLAKITNGTYRAAVTGPEVEQYLNHVESEITGQHLLTLKSTDFDGDRELTFKLEVSHDKRKYASNASIAFVAPAESDLLTYILAGVGAIVGLVVLFILIKLLIRARSGRRSRRDRDEVDAGPEMRPCGQCGNMTPPDWAVCRYCEALPHYGRLTVKSVGELNGATWFIKDTLTNIGSAQGNTIVILHSSVSKRHAGIKVENNRFELADFGSTNGVMVNDQRITKQFLRNGDVIQVGAIQLAFDLKS